jgi:hypothetical protein
MSLILKVLMAATVFVAVAACGDAGSIATESTKTSERVEK